MALTRLQNLEDVIHFTGKVDVNDYYPQIDIIVLTSISEGQPIVILEAQAAGISIVATNVGACADPINGSSPDDRLLGPSGIVTPFYDQEKTAEAVLRILKDTQLYKQMSDAGKKRVASFYRMEKLVAEYQKLYFDAMLEVNW